jgi:hypothetical protein
LEWRLDNFNANLPKMKEMLKKLEHEYDLYFSGERKFPPGAEHKELETAVTFYSRSTLPTTAAQYLFMNFQQSWTLYSNKWKKMMELKLNGIVEDPRLTGATRVMQKKFSDLDKARSEDLMRESAAAKAQAQMDTQPLPPRPAAASPVRALFDEFNQAKMRTGQTLDLDPAAFEQKIEKQKKELMEKYKAKDVVFTVAVTGDKVSLKAKIVKSDKGEEK